MFSLAQHTYGVDSRMATPQAGAPIFPELSVALCDMFRIAQRTVHYATKAYESQRLEYSRYVRHERHRFDYLRQKVLLAFADMVDRTTLREGQRLLQGNRLHNIVGSSAHMSSR